jgi:hypothetical protein
MLESLNRPAYAPAAGRLAAAIATIWARRRPIRDGAVRNIVATCRISHLPSEPAERSFQQQRALWKMVSHG